MNEQLDTSLIGKPIDELSPAELASLASQLSTLSTEIDTRQKTVRDQAQDEVLNQIAIDAESGMRKLAWQKLPKLTLVPDADGAHYTVAYAATKGKSKGNGGKRTASEPNSGAITVNKIIVAHGGGIAWFRNEKTGEDFENVKKLVASLKQEDGITSEGDRCWDITQKVGISASDIVIKHHAEEVTLVFNDGIELLVKDAVEKMKEARAGVAAS